MPRDIDAYRPSFEAYASLIGSVVSAAGFGKPFTARVNVMGGDEEGRAVEELLSAVAARVADGETVEFTTNELLTTAEETALLDAITLAKDQRKSLGQKLKAWRGRQLRDGKGRLFEFGKRDGSRGAIYPVSILDDNR